MFNLKTNLSNPTYHLTKIQNKLYSAIEDYLDDSDMNQTDLGNKLGVGKSYISQLLNNGSDHKLSKFIKLSLAIDLVPKIELLPKSEFLKAERRKRLIQAKIKSLHVKEIDPEKGLHLSFIQDVEHARAWRKSDDVNEASFETNTFFNSCGFSENLMKC